MFYSHNLLAKKAPLGTVWVAAHLQHKLKKSNIVTVNISSTVEQIMYPQVPIALRTYSYLLLGVVRIYSKKVEYLQHDCNVLRIDITKAYANADINLPEDANQAKYESITLPDNFALDLIDIDNHHLNLYAHLALFFSKNIHETPAGYIKISFGEVSMDPSISGDNPGPGPMPVEEISHPQTPPSTIGGIEAPDLNHHSGSSDIFNGDNVSPPETLRNNNNLQKSPLVSVLPDNVEVDPVMVKHIAEFDGNHSSNLDFIPENGGPSSSPKKISPLEFVRAEHDPVQDNLGSQVLFELAPSPQKAKRRAELAPFPPRVKRRTKYDQATVLTNDYMKKSIDDASGLKRKRKGVSSFLGVYRLNNVQKKQKVLTDPVFTGLCDNLCQLLEDGYVCSKTSLISIEQADPDAVEFGRFNNFVDPIDNNMIPISPSYSIPFSSPHTVDENTPAISTDVGAKSYQTTIGTSVGPTPDPASSNASLISDMETPFSPSRCGFDKSGGLYDIAEDEELAFMEDDDGTPGLVGTPRGSSLLPRTRCLAKLIKEKSEATPSTSENHGSVSMKSILQGKTRKVCSRMFFETLVLKSCDLVDVKQDQPYGDISMKVTQKLSKLDFSN
ncbi:hypothetical protein E3N88_13957 [Mikania micrantha]|uniref:Rad21/Rec8-like protein N-terminal domain-containing protein n=1 Tax=Mikania micrantha TaxID=192012 RepID=A0A5N6P1C4_9ASTR|nr:hypothetical protein E3N88_13957 [Mikania micrantha]